MKVNIAKVDRPKKSKNNRNQNCLSIAIYDLSKLKYYNCNTKSYYLNNYTKFLKTRFDFGNFYTSN